MSMNASRKQLTGVQEEAAHRIITSSCLRKVGDLEHENGQLQNKINDLENSQNINLDLISNLEAQVEDLSKQNTDLQQRNTQITAEINTLNAEKMNFNQKINVMENNHKKEIEKLEGQIEILNNNLQKSQNEHKNELESIKNNNFVNSSKLNEDIANAQNQILQLQDENKLLTSQLSEIKNKSLGKTETLESEKESLSQKLVELQKQIDDLTNSNQVLTLQYENANIEISKLTDELSDSNETIINLKSELNNSNESMEAVKTELENSKDLISALEGEIEMARSNDNEQLQKTWNDLKIAKEENTALHNKVNELEKSNNTLSQKLTEIGHSLNEAEKKVADEVSNLKSDKERIQSEYENKLLAQENNKIEEINKLKIEFQDTLLLKSKEITSIKEEKSNLINSIQEKTSKINQLQEDFDRLSQEKTEMESRFQSMLDEAARNNGAFSAQQEERIKELQRELNDSKNKDTDLKKRLKQAQEEHRESYAKATNDYNSLFEQYSNNVNAISALRDERSKLEIRIQQLDGELSRAKSAYEAASKKFSQERADLQNQIDEITKEHEEYIRSNAQEIYNLKGSNSEQERFVQQLQGELKKLRSEVSKANAVIDSNRVESESTLKVLSEQLQKAKEQLKNSEELQSESEEQIRQLQRDLSNARSELQEIMSKPSEESVSGEAVESIGKMNTEIAAIIAENEELKEKISQLETELNETTNLFTLKPSERDIVDLTTKLEAHQKENERFKTQIESLEASLKEERDKSNSYVDEITAILTEKAELTDDISRLEDRNKLLEGDVQALQKQNENLKALEAKLAEAAFTIGRLESEMEELRQSSDSINKEYQAVKEKAAESSDRLFKALIRNIELVSENVGLGGKIVNILAEASKKSTVDMENAETQITESAENIEGLVQNIRELNSIAMEISADQSQIQYSVQDQNVSVDEMVSQLQDKISFLREQNAELIAESQGRELSISNLNELHQRSVTDSEELREKLEQMKEEYENKVNMMELRIADLTGRLETVNRENEELEMETRDSEGFRKKLEIAMEDIKTLQGDKDSYLKELQDADTFLSNAREREEEIRKLNKMISEYRYTIEDLHTQIATMKVAMEEADREKSAALKKADAAGQEIAKAQEEFSAQVKAINDKLIKYQKDLEEANNHLAQANAEILALENSLESAKKSTENQLNDAAEKHNGRVKELETKLSNNIRTLSKMEEVNKQQALRIGSLMEALQKENKDHERRLSEITESIQRGNSNELVSSLSEELQNLQKSALESKQVLDAERKEMQKVYDELNESKSKAFELERTIRKLKATLINFEALYPVLNAKEPIEVVIAVKKLIDLSKVPEKSTGSNNGFRISALETSLKLEKERNSNLRKEIEQIQREKRRSIPEGTISEALFEFLQALEGKASKSIERAARALRDELERGRIIGFEELASAICGSLGGFDTDGFKQHIENIGAIQNNSFSQMHKYIGILESKLREIQIKIQRLPKPGPKSILKRNDRVTIITHQDEENEMAEVKPARTSNFAPNMNKFRGVPLTPNQNASRIKTLAKRVPSTARRPSPPIFRSRDFDVRELTSV